MDEYFDSICTHCGIRNFFYISKSESGDYNTGCCWKCKGEWPLADSETIEFEGEEVEDGMRFIASYEDEKLIKKLLESPLPPQGEGAGASIAFTIRAKPADWHIYEQEIKRQLGKYPHKELTTTSEQPVSQMVHNSEIRFKGSYESYICKTFEFQSKDFINFKKWAEEKIPKYFFQIAESWEIK